MDASNKAINAYTNGGGTLDYKNDFEAYFQNDNTSGWHEGNHDLGSGYRPHYTLHHAEGSDLGNLSFGPSPQENVIIKSKHSNGRVTGGKIRAILTVADLKPDNTSSAHYSTELIADVNNRTFANNSHNDWRWFWINHNKYDPTQQDYNGNYPYPGLSIHDSGNKNYQYTRSDGLVGLSDMKIYDDGTNLNASGGNLSVTMYDDDDASDNYARSQGVALNVNSFETETTADDFTIEHPAIGFTYRVSAKIVSSSGTLTGFRMQLGDTKSDLFDISTSTTPIVRDLYFGIGGYAPTIANDIIGVAGVPASPDTGTSSGIYNTPDNYDGSLRIYKEIGDTTTSWYIDDVSKKRMPPTFVGDDDTWYNTGCVLLEGIWFDESIMTGEGLMWTHEAREGFHPGTAVRIGSATNPTTYIRYCEIDENDGPEKCRIFFHTGNENDFKTGAIIDDSESVLYLYKQRVNIKSVMGWNHMLASNQYSIIDAPDSGDMDSLILGGKTIPGNGFSRDLLGSYDTFINGRSTYGYYTQIIGFPGPSASGDIVKVNYTLPDGTEGELGPYSFSSTKNNDVNAIATDLNALTGISASKLGPEIIYSRRDRIGTSNFDSGDAGDDASGSDAYNGWGLWKSSGAGSCAFNIIDTPRDGNDLIRVRNSSTNAAHKIGVTLNGDSYSDYEDGTLLTQTDGGSLSRVASNCNTASRNILRANKAYTITFDAKHDINSGQSLQGFRVALGNEETVAFAITDSWATYTKEITLSSSVPETTDVFTDSQLRIYSANTYASPIGSNAKYWSIRNISLKQSSTISYITTTSLTLGTAGMFNVAPSIETYYGTGEIVPEGRTEEFTSLIVSGGLENNYDGYTKYFAHFHIHSKLNGLWNEKFKWDENGFDWYYTKNDSTGEYNYPDILMWNESNRLRIVDTNFIDSLSSISNQAKYLDKFNISSWFQSDYSTYQWDVQSPNTALNSIFINNVDKVWNKSISSSDSRGLFIDSDTDDLISIDTYGNNGAAVKFKFSKLSPTYNASTGVLEKGREGNDFAGIMHFYAAAIYDDGGEGLPAHKFSSEIEFSGQTILDVDLLTDTLKVEAAIKPTTISGELAFDDLRIIGLRIYYTHSEEGHETFWSLGKLTWKDGFLKSTSISTIDNTAGNQGRIIWRTLQGDANILTLLDTSQNYTSGEVVDLDADTTVTVDSGIPVREGMYLKAQYQGRIADETYITTVTGGTEGSSVTAFTINQAALATANNQQVDFEQRYVHFRSMPKLESFESINGYSPYNSTLKAKYKAHCIGGRRSFIGNVEMHDGIFNDRMIVSPVNQLDTYPYPGNVLDLDISDGDEIVGLANVGDKILQFKRNMCYIINISTAIPSEFFVEERHKFKGIFNRNHFVETSDGIFWVNNFSAYFYNGEELIDLHNSNEEDNTTKRISSTVWKNFISNESQVGYNPISKDCFVVRSSTMETKKDGDCYIYNLQTNSWTFGHGKFFTGDSTKITNFINVGSDSNLGYIYNQAYGINPQDDGSPL